MIRYDKRARFEIAAMEIARFLFEEIRLSIFLIV